MKRYFKILILAFCTVTLGCSDKYTVDEINYIKLDAMIILCQSELENAVEGSQNGQYVIGSKAIFSNVLSQAEYVKTNADRQSAIDNYTIKLGAARDVFNKSRVALGYAYFGGTAYIDCGPADKLINPVYSIEIWVRMSSQTTDGAAIFGAEGTDGTTWDGFMLRRAEGVENALDFCVVNGMWSSTLTPAKSFSFEKWTHVACTFDGRVAKVYLNGIEAGSQTMSEYITKCHGNLYIGDMAYFKGRYLIGNAYDFRIWNTIRTPEQIKDNMNILLNGDEDGLVANWQLNKKCGNSNVDITGKHTATLIDVVWTEVDGLVE